MKNCFIFENVPMVKNKAIIKKIATYRMNYLFQRAHDVFPENKQLANRYVQLARKYAQRAKIPVPREWSRRICSKCKQFLYPGVNCRYRVQSRRGKGSHVSLTCLECLKVKRYYIKTSK